MVLWAMRHLPELGLAFVWRIGMYSAKESAMYRNLSFLRLCLCLVCCLPVITAAQPIVTKTITYQDGDVNLQGLLAMPAEVTAATPAVVVVHDWYGCGAYPQQRAREMAERGYIALAIDMYGDGKVVTTREDASGLAGGFYKDVPLMIRRTKAGLTTLRAQPHVDQQRVAAIGFCFGGTVALNLARSGEKLAGVVSFHGGLKVALPVEPGAISAKILVLHGGADPHVPPTDVANFMMEMTTAKADWRFEMYGGVVHSFSNPSAGNNVAGGSAYNAEAEQLSLAHMDRFFVELFTKP
jgi:dienelactone hydrolase